MIVWAVPMRQRAHDIWTITRRVLLAAAIAALTYLATSIGLATAGGQFDMLGHEASPWGLALAATVYLTGHGLRILRLALLIGGWRVGFRVIVSFHLMTAAASLAIPLKLGEVYRVVELSNVVDSFIRAVAIVWWERAFDVSLILLILLLALTRAPGEIPPEFLAVAVLAIGFITATALTFFIVPDNLRRLSVLIIRRYTSRHTVPVLRMIDLVRHAIQEAPRMVHGKIASLATLTALIWAFEIAAFAIVLRMLGVTLAAAPDALLSFLSAVTRGETLLGVLDVSDSATSDVSVLFYLAATQMPLAFIGLGAAAHYIGRSMRQRR